MRSKISKKILIETSQETKDKVNDYANKLILSSVSKNVCTHGAYEYLGNKKFRCLNKKCNEVVTF